eukprot:6190513-Pleurochrysis_carterae.AAC.6
MALRVVASYQVMTWPLSCASQGIFLALVRSWGDAGLDRHLREVRSTAPARMRQAGARVAKHARSPHICFDAAAQTAHFWPMSTCAPRHALCALPRASCSARTHTRTHTWSFFTHVRACMNDRLWSEMRARSILPFTTASTFVVTLALAVARATLHFQSLLRSPVYEEAHESVERYGHTPHSLVDRSMRSNAASALAVAGSTQVRARS